MVFRNKIGTTLLFQRITRVGEREREKKKILAKYTRCDRLNLVNTLFAK